MNDVLHFVETLEPYFMRDGYVNGRRRLTVWPPKMKSLWRKARKALLWFILPKNAKEVTDDACADALDLMAEFASDVERMLGPAACSFNLHQLICRCGSFSQYFIAQ